MAGSLYIEYDRNHVEAHLKDVYRVRVMVLDPHEIPVGDARVWSDKGGKPKSVDGGWQFDIPWSMSGLVTFYASKQSAHLTGKTGLELASNYNPLATIHLVHPTDASIRGVVVDANGNHVAGAFEVVGYSYEGITTKQDGGFVLAAHSADGEDVQLHTQKVGYQATYSALCGDNPATVILDHSA